MDPLARRLGGAGMRRGLRITGGTRILLPFGKGTFARSSDGTYMTSATALATAGSNVLRLEDRGDGNGPAYLLEGARTNLLEERRPNNFSTKNGVVINALAGTSLLDARTQDTVDFGQAAPDHRIFDAAAGTAAAVAHAHSFWWKVLSGTNTNQQITPQLASSTGRIQPVTSPSDWTYETDVSTYAGTEGIGQLWTDGAIETKTLIWDAHQFEVGGFPSSYVDVNGATASRVADSLTFASGAYPTRLVSGKWKFHFYPYFKEDEETSDVTLLSFGGSNDELRYNATSDAFEILTSNVQRGISSALTFSRHQKITLTIDWLARELVVAGATTGNGTTALSDTDEWPSNVTMRIGGRQGATQECFGRYTEPEAA